MQHSIIVPRKALQTLQGFLDASFTDKGRLTDQSFCTDGKCCTSSVYEKLRLLDNTTHPLAVFVETTPGQTPPDGIPTNISLFGRDGYELASVICATGANGHFFAYVRVYGQWYKSDPFYDFGVMHRALSSRMHFLGANKRYPTATDKVCAMVYTAKGKCTPVYAQITTHAAKLGDGLSQQASAARSAASMGKLMNVLFVVS